MCNFFFLGQKIPVILHHTLHPQVCTHTFRGLYKAGYAPEFLKNNCTVSPRLNKYNGGTKSVKQKQKAFTLI